VTTNIATEMSTGSVVSRDGTSIGYLRVGQGPALVLLHGSMETARSHAALALALSDAFTVYLPDRRGRGLSGPYPAGYGMRTELEDLAAVLEVAGAELVFGVSASGLVALEAARTMPAIRKVAVYEPALLPAGSKHVNWLPRFDREMRAGDTAGALVTSMLGLELMPPVIKVIPRPVLKWLSNLAMKSEEKKAGPDTVTMRALAPTVYYEGVLLAEMAGQLDTFADVRAEVLLLGGSKGLAFLKPALDDLARMLPDSRRVEFAGLDHGGSADVSNANRGGKPEVVAAELRRFLQAA
jgi:pimeloyl-ACP methyl ester carboxylesterase